MPVPSVPGNLQVHPGGSSTQQLSSVTLVAGPATFGFSLPQGQAIAGLQVGALITQTDIKTRWPDGSIRFCILSCIPTSQGTYPITATSGSPGSFTPSWPTASVTYTIAGTAYTATLPTYSNTNPWLSGPVCNEARVLLTPANGATNHPLLQVIADIRTYSNGAYRVDICSQNVKDSSQMDKVTYDLSIQINGATVYSRVAFTQYALTRWRKTFTIGYTEQQPVLDFTTAYQAGALPRYLSTINNQTYNTSTAAWDINGFGSMNPLMDAAAWRPELSPFADWEAQYLIHQDPTQFAAAKLNAACGGSWCLHLMQPDGVNLIKVTTVPNYWADVRSGGPPNGPAIPMRPDGQWRGMRSGVSGGYSDIETRTNEEHVPNISYVPYMVTGDRFFLDQTKIWAAYWILMFSSSDPVLPEPVFEPLFNRSRGGAFGRQWRTGLTRELGHPFTVTVCAAIATPDADPDKAYFKGVVQHQLDGLGDYTVRTSLAAGVSEGMGWEGWRTQDQGGLLPGRYMSLWRIGYTCYAIAFASLQNLWTMGNAPQFVHRAVRSQQGFIANGATGGEQIPSYPAIATTSNNNQAISFFSDWPTLLAWNRANWTQSFGTTPIGYHGVEANMLLAAGVVVGSPNASTTKQWLLSYHDSFGALIGDLNARSGYALS